jgi:hypothetical protein
MRLLVVFPMAARTTTGVSSGKLMMRSATSLIRSADATEDPPNFITTVNPATAAVVDPPDTAGVAPSPLFIVVVAAALLSQQTTSLFGFLCTQLFPPGLAAADRETESLMSLLAERAAAAISCVRGAEEEEYARESQRW